MTQPNIQQLVCNVKKNCKLFSVFPEKAKIARRLREFGEMKYGKMADFARALGVEPQVLHNYLGGRVSPGAKMLARLRALGCDIAWLMYGEHEQEIHDQFELFVKRKAEMLRGGTVRNDELEILAYLRSMGVATLNELTTVIDSEKINLHFADKLSKKMKGTSGAKAKSDT